MPRSAPTILSATPVDDEVSQAVVLPPATGSWATYQLTVCKVANPTDCVSSVPPCAVNATGPAICKIPIGLQLNIQFSVSVLAQAAGSPNSQRSSSTTWTTLNGVPPGLKYPSTLATKQSSEHPGNYPSPRAIDGSLTTFMHTGETMSSGLPVDEFPWW